MASRSDRRRAAAWASGRKGECEEHSRLASIRGAASLVGFDQERADPRVTRQHGARNPKDAQAHTVVADPDKTIELRDVRLAPAGRPSLTCNRQRVEAVEVRLAQICEAGVGERTRG